MSAVNTTDVPTHTLSVLEVVSDEVREILHCLFHSILFHRALGPTTPLDITMNQLNIDYIKCDNADLNKRVDEYIENVLKQLNTGVFLGVLTVVLTFYSNEKISGALWDTHNKRPWEHWIVELKLVKTQKEKLNIIYQNKIDTDAAHKQKVINTVLQQNFAASGCVPQVTNAAQMAVADIKKCAEKNAAAKKKLEAIEAKRLSNLGKKVQENLFYISEQAALYPKEIDYIPKAAKNELCYPFKIERIMDLEPNLLATMATAVSNLLILPNFTLK